MRPWKWIALFLTIYGSIFYIVISYVQTSDSITTFEIWIDEESKIQLRYQFGSSDSHEAPMIFKLNNYRNFN